MDSFEPVPKKKITKNKNRMITVLYKRKSNLKWIEEEIHFKTKIKHTIWAPKSNKRDEKALKNHCFNSVFAFPNNFFFPYQKQKQKKQKKNKKKTFFFFHMFPPPITTLPFPKKKSWPTRKFIFIFCFQLFSTNENLAFLPLSFLF